MDNEMFKNNIVESSSVEATDNLEMQNISKLGGTNNDEHDMAMLGRTQVLNVRDRRIQKCCQHITYTGTAQLPLHLDFGICLYPDEHLGDRIDVRTSELKFGAVILMCNRTSFFGLLNGGTAGLIWGYLIVWVGYMLVFASIAEMASMYAITRCSGMSADSREGPLHLEVNITGYPNLLPHDTRSFSVTSLVSQNGLEMYEVDSKQ